MKKIIIIAVVAIAIIGAVIVSQANNKSITQPLNTLTGSDTLKMNENMQNSIKKSTDSVNKQYNEQMPPGNQGQ